MVEGYHAAPLDRAGERGLSTAGDPPSDPEDRTQHRLPAGYDAIPGRLAAEVDAARCRMFLSTVAREVRWKPGRVVVATDAGDFTGERALVTVPIGVLHTPVGRPGSIRFDPEVPAMRRSVERIGMGQAVRIVLRLREPFWADDPPKAWRNGRAGHPRDLAFLHVPGRDFPTWWTAAPSETPMLTGWAGGPAASALARLPPTKIPDRALGTLSAIFGMPHERLARLLVGWHVHDWGADPYSRGAYSFTAVGGASAPEDLSRPVARTLYFAGEATARGKTGTVPGAIASGERAARQILREG